MTLDEWLLETREKLKRFERSYRAAAAEDAKEWPLEQTEQGWVDSFDIWSYIEDTPMPGQTRPTEQ